MRVFQALVICAAAIFLAAGPLPARAQEGAKGAAQPGVEAKDTNAQDTRITLHDIRQSRGKRISRQQVADMAAEQGRAFEVTADVARELHNLGFSAAQVDAIKKASPDPLVPGKWLSSDEASRDATLDAMQKVAAKSGAAIEPVASQHMTLWAAKDVQRLCLPDLQKAEKFFHTKCAEPIRSGLDKRAAHIVLLKDRAEYEAWWRAMLELYGKQFEVKDNPGFTEQFRRDVLKAPIYHYFTFAVVCLAEVQPVVVHHNVAYGAGFQCVAQLGTRSDYGLEMGFGNCAETAVCGFPVMTGGEMIYGKEASRASEPVQDWSLLAKQQMATRKATPLADLLKTDQSAMSQSLCAERWALVSLLNEQPAKFGKLLRSLKDDESDLASIEKIYVWNEKELGRQLRVYVMKLAKKKAG